MIIRIDQIIEEINNPPDPKDPLVITPLPNREKIINSGSASIDLRLGSWFRELRKARVQSLNIYDKQSKIPSESKLTKSYYVPLGEPYILHPKAFVLGITLEWIRLRRKFSGYVVGRSSWGRHGLIIATATGVHPGFTGCLTLELTNVGEIPIMIKPGTTICQLFIHDVSDSKSTNLDKSHFIGRRKPVLGYIKLDEIAIKLQKE